MDKNKNEDIPPIAMPGTQQKNLPYFLHQNPDDNQQVLDIEAGYSALSKKLHELGFHMRACDLFPEKFRYKAVTCDFANIMEKLPYKNESFDLAIAVEVVEHINDHEIFFRECQRVLKKGGKLYLSTPNILSWKSRFRFLFSGYFYSFQPLELDNHDGLQHVSSLTIDQYNYIAGKYGFVAANVDVDKYQKSSTWLMGFYPLSWIYSKLKGLWSFHNHKKLLLRRLLFLEYCKL